MDNTPTDKYLGYNIKRLRQRSKMTQSQLAEELGLSKQIISAYEKGRRTPSHGTLVKITKTLGTNMSELYSTGADPKYIDATGLNDEQIGMIFKLVQEMKKLNDLVSDEI